MNQLLIINATIINSDSTFDSDIAFREGVISEIGNLNPSDFPSYKIIDAKGKYIFPGGIDPRVHLELHTPVGPLCDDFLSGSKAAKSVISLKSQIQQCDSNIYKGMKINGEAEYVLSRGEIIRKPDLH